MILPPLGGIWIPAPISRASDERSRMTTSRFSRRHAIAHARPPRPPPTMMTFMFSCCDGWKMHVRCKIYFCGRGTDRLSLSSHPPPNIIVQSNKRPLHTLLPTTKLPSIEILPRPTHQLPNLARRARPQTRDEPINPQRHRSDRNQERKEQMHRRMPVPEKRHVESPEKHQRRE